MTTILVQPYENIVLTNEYCKLYTRLRKASNKNKFLFNLPLFLIQFRKDHPIIDTPTDDLNLNNINHEYKNNIMQINNFFNNNDPPLFHIDRANTLVQDFYRSFIETFSNQ